MSEPKQWVTDTEYVEESFDTIDLELADGKFNMRVQQVPPMRFAELAEEYDVEGLQSTIADEDEDASLADSGVEGVAGVLTFLQDEVVPQIERPKNAHWNEPPSDPNAEEVFNVANLRGEDLTKLIQTIVASDNADDVMSDAGQYQGRFRQQSRSD